MKPKTPRSIVLEYYPEAKPVNVGCKGGNKKYYHIMSGDTYLGKGKTKEQAWKAAYRNIND